MVTSDSPLRLFIVVAIAMLLSACSSGASTIPVVGTIGGANAASPSQALTKSSIWQLVTSPNYPPDSAGLYDDQLNGVGGSSPNDVWAVGRMCCTPHGTQEYYSSLLMHWNGSTWALVPGASNEPADVQLYGVTAITPKDAWAVGQGISPNVALIEHWNGTKWSVASSPGGFKNAELKAVTALSSKNVWAVGDANFQPLIEHWNGKTWSLANNVTSAGGFTSLGAIAASSSNDIMAVGSHSSPNLHMFAEHWNGSSWTNVSPGTYYFLSNFAGVASLGNNRYLAAGWEDVDQETPQTLVEEWNGSKFTRMTTPNDEPKTGHPLTNQLWSVAAQSSNDAWAVGLWTYYPGAGTTRSLFEHWNGKKWTIAAGPPALESSNNNATNELLDIARVGPKTLWAVGNQDIPPNCCEETLTVETTHG